MPINKRENRGEKTPGLGKETLEECSSSCFAPPLVVAIDQLFVRGLFLLLLRGREWSLVIGEEL